ncbi:MAG: hypothetical protein DRO01_03780, partial [Thermoproteota archaeon]
MKDLAVDPMLHEAKTRLSRADRVVAISAGKGGVGKSFITAAMALTLAEKGRRVGVLDLDVHGPTLPKILGANGQITAWKGGLRPLRSGDIELMSVGFMIGEEPLPSSGGEKMSLISTMVALTDWGDLDYLLIDVPPGTGEETTWLLRALRGLGHAGALVVTTPSLLAESVVRRLLKLLRDEKVRILGLVENLSYFMCGGELVRPFGEGAAERLSREFAVPVLARLPIDPSIEEAILSKNFYQSLSEGVRSAISELVEAVEALSLP